MTDKNYQVLDVNGNEIKVVKSLSIAKKLATAESGSVVCDGECVFKAKVQEPTPEPEAQKPETYRIKMLMNVRAEPSLNGKVLDVVAPGTDVDVIAVEDDWLHLVNGAFILYGSGEYAERLCKD